MASQLRTWIDGQAAALRMPDIKMLTDAFVTIPDNDEVESLAYGILGSSPQVKSFITELQKRRLAVFSTAAPGGAKTSKPSTNARPRAAPTTTTSTTTSGKLSSLDAHMNHQQKAPQKQPKQQPQQNSFFDDQSLNASHPIMLDSSASNMVTTFPPQKQSKNQQQNQQQAKSSKTATNKSFLASVGTETSQNNNGPTSEYDSLLPVDDNSTFLNQDDQDVLDMVKLLHADDENVNKMMNSHLAMQNSAAIFPVLGSARGGASGGKNVGASASKITAQERIADQFGKQLAMGSSQKKKPSNHPTNSFSTKPSTTTTTSTTTTAASTTTSSNEPTQPPVKAKSQPPVEPVFTPPTQYESRCGPNRLICQCIAREHPFYASCDDCGRVKCFAEGEGECAFCGAYIIQYDANKQLVTIARAIKHLRASKSQSDKNSTKKHKDKHDVTAIFAQMHQEAKTHGGNSSQQHLPLEQRLQQLLELNINIAKDINVLGTGLLCLSNGTFRQTLTEQHTALSKGYYLRNNKKNNAMIEREQILSRQTAEQRDTAADQSNASASTAIRQNSAYGMNTSTTTGTHAPLTSLEQEQQGLAKATKFRDTLLEREKQKAKLTHVIDEQNDYYEFAPEVQNTMSVEFDARGKAIVSTKRHDILDLAIKSSIRSANEDINVNVETIEQTKALLQRQQDMENNVNTIKAEREREFIEHMQQSHTNQVAATGKTITIQDGKANREAFLNLVRNVPIPSSNDKSQELGTAQDGQHLQGLALVVYNHLQQTLRDAAAASAANDEDDNDDDDDGEAIDDHHHNKVKHIMSSLTWSQRLRLMDEVLDQDGVPPEEDETDQQFFTTEGGAFEEIV